MAIDAPSVGRSFTARPNYTLALQCTAMAIGASDAPSQFVRRIAAEYPDLEEEGNAQALKYAALVANR